MTKQLLEVIDTIDLNEAGIKIPLEKEIERYQKFRSSVLGVENTDQGRTPEVDIRNYAKYILREANRLEKRELLSHLRSRLLLKNGIVSII